MKIDLMRLTARCMPWEAADPLRLLEGLQGQPRWAWLDDEQTLIAWGEVTAIQGDSPGALAAQLARLRREIDAQPGADVLLFGGLPFARGGEADSLWAGLAAPRFVLPRYIYRQTPSGGRLTSLQPEFDLPPVEAGRRPAPLPPARWEDEISYPQWESLVEVARRAARAGRIQKVVFARSRRVTFESAPPLVTAFARLCQRYPQTYRFYFEPAPGQVFLGAAPELLASVRSLNLETVALAGSAARGRTPGEDRRLGAALLASPKNRREQAIVVERICDDLQPLCAFFRYPETPRLRKLPNIQHLETPIQGRLKNAGIFAPAWALHPTPALAGQPRDAAMALIARHEPLPRGYYGAPVGWTTLSGDGALAVAIRSAVFHRNEGRLYAGAGLLAASQPEKEWEEITLKFRPMMEALDLCEEAA